MLDRPLHPMFVHFPIAFYLLGVLLTLGYLWQRIPDYERFAYWSFLLAWIGVAFVANGCWDLVPSDCSKYSITACGVLYWKKKVESSARPSSLLSRLHSSTKSNDSNPMAINGLSAS